MILAVHVEYFLPNAVLNMSVLPFVIEILLFLCSNTQEILATTTLYLMKLLCTDNVPGVNSTVTL